MRVTPRKGRGWGEARLVGPGWRGRRWRPRYGGYVPAGCRAAVRIGTAIRVPAGGSRASALPRPRDELVRERRASRGVAGPPPHPHRRRFAAHAVPRADRIAPQVATRRPQGRTLACAAPARAPRSCGLSPFRGLLSLRSPAGTPAASDVSGWLRVQELLVLANVRGVRAVATHLPLRACRLRRERVYKGGL